MFAVNSVRGLYDTLRNFVTGLGTPKDPRVSSQWALRILNRFTLETAYRSDWLARRLVDLPPYDRTREWRTWKATGKQLQAIDRLEKHFFLQSKVMQAEQKARLYGGGALVLGVDVGEPEDELDPDDIGKDDLKFVCVLNCYELAAGPRIYNVMSPYYTRPQYYTVSTPMFGFMGESGEAYPTNPAQTSLVLPPRQPYGTAPLASDPQMRNQPSYGMIRIHPSRVIEFAGNPLPDWRLAPMGAGWGDSVLQTVDDALRDFAMVMGGLASVINDMKLDVVSVPELSRHLGTEDMTKKFIERWQLANQAKSTINTLLIDEKEKWERIQTNFGSTPDLIRVAMQVACAGGGVPMSRVMGMAPNKGLGNDGTSGEVDLHAYYDDQASIQNTDNRRIMYMLDCAVKASAIGSNDPDVDYEWNPLYRENPQEQADVALKKAQTTQIYFSLGTINEDALREGVISQLTEDGTYPSLEQAIDKYGAEPEEPEPEPQQMLPTPPPGMVNKGQFEANPFHMLRAQAAAKAGLPVRVPPNDPRRALPAPKQPTKDEDAELDDFNPYHDPKSGRFTTAQGTAEAKAAAKRARETHARRSASAKAAHARRRAVAAEPFPLPAGASAHQAGVTAVHRVISKATGGKAATKGEVGEAAKADVRAAVEEFAATRHMKEPKLPEGVSADQVKTAYRVVSTARKFVKDPESGKVLRGNLIRNSMSWAARQTPEHLLHVAHSGMVDFISEHVTDMITEATMDGVVAGVAAAGAALAGPPGAAAGVTAGYLFKKAVGIEVRRGLDKLAEATGFTPEHIKHLLGGVGHALGAHYRKWRELQKNLFYGALELATPAAAHDAEPFDPIEEALAGFDEAVEDWEPEDEDEDEDVD